MNCSLLLLVLIFDGAHDRGFTSHDILVTSLGLLGVKESEELCLLSLADVSDIWRTQSRSTTPQLRDAVVLGLAKSECLQLCCLVLSCLLFLEEKQPGDSRPLLGVKQIRLHGASMLM